MKIARKISGALAALVLMVAGITGINVVTDNLPEADAAAISCYVYHDKKRWTGYLYTHACGYGRYWVKAKYKGKTTTHYAPFVGLYGYSRLKQCYVGSITSDGGQIISARKVIYV